MTGRANTLMVLVIMTVLVVLGSVLVGLILGPGADPGTTPSKPPTEQPTDEDTAGAGGSDAEKPEPQADTQPDFVLASFNVLGNSHTTDTGKEPDLDSGPRRLRRALRLLRQENVSVVGLQELQRPQAREFESRAGDDWRLFHSADDSENSIAWRRQDWSKLEARTVAVPYFNGNTREMPVVRLRHRKTGAKVWFINVHNPANTLQFPDQDEYRAQANAIELQLAEQLARNEGSVVFLGDLNQRAEAYCYFTKSGTLISGTGEARQKPCQEPAYGGIDWIFGTQNLTFSDWSVREEGVLGITSDHPLVTVSVSLPG